ncbi:hypothetical protein GC173_04140 [bacterium]|nr:hypothetical protein [bacterium]
MMSLFSNQKTPWPLLLVTLVLMQASWAVAAPVRWISNPDEAKLIQAEKKKPAVIFFFNEQARPAMQMQTETMANSEVTARLGDFVCAAIDQAAHPDMAGTYKLVKVPTVVFLDAEGKEIDRAVGNKPASEFVRYLDRISSAFRTKAVDSEISPFKVAAVDILTAQTDTISTNLAFYAADAKQVFIVGDFNDWRVDATPMNKAENGFWNITLHLASGIYEYMYLVDGETYQPDPTNPFKKQNRYGGANSVLLIGNPRVSPVVTGNSVMFRLYEPNASEISVAGSFNNWAAFTMFRNEKDPAEWGVRYDNVPAGTYQYKFIIDGVWTMDPENYTPGYDSNNTMNSSFTIK